MRLSVLMSLTLMGLTAITLCLSMPISAADLSLESALPRGFASGWAPEGKVSLFNPDTLFEHINGEAELYMPYRFDLLATASYANKKYPEQLVVADVYRMGTLLDAFGIYSNYRKPDYESAAIGADGFLSSTQMMFYQDRYFVRLQATGATGLDREIFLDCAKTVSRNLPANSSRPTELGILSLPSIVRSSERYLAQSLLGYAFFRRGFVMDAVVSGESMRVFVVSEASRELAHKAFEAYRAYLKEEGQGVQVAATKERRVLTAVDSLYGEVLVEEFGPYLIGAIKIKDKDAAKRLIGQLREKMVNR